MSKILIDYKIERTVSGLTLTVKSEIAKEFFRNSEPLKQLNAGNEATIPCYNILPEIGASINSTLDIAIRGCEHEWVSPAASTNYSFFRAENIDTGIVLNAKGLYSKERIDGISRDMKQTIKAIYTEFIKPAHAKVTMIVQEETVLSN